MSDSWWRLVFGVAPDPSQRFARPAAMEKQFARGRVLIKRVRGLGVETISGATVWNATWRGEDGAQVDMIRDGRAARCRPAQLILATGAHERPCLENWQV